MFSAPSQIRRTQENQISLVTAPLTTPGPRESDTEDDDEEALGGHILFLPLYVCFRSPGLFPINDAPLRFKKKNDITPNPQF
jgi:hypothetical protein